MNDPLEIRIDGRAARNVIRGFRKAPDIVSAVMIPAVIEGQLLFEREVKENTPVGIGGGGGLKGSISSREPAVIDGDIIGEVGTPLAYAIPVELGAQPHMPPVRPLVDWARHKLGLDIEEAERVGFAIALKIKAQGTEGAHMFADAHASTSHQIEGILTRAGERVGEKIAEAAK